jgi:mannose-6-phosphate isomerase-like protein (cupin superfamily)
MIPFATKRLPEDVEHIAPDGSEIRLLGRVNGGSFCHCTLPEGKTSLAVRNRTVEEIWYFLEGEGQVWRKQGQREDVVDVSPGTGLTMPAGTHFQFRNTGAGPLRFVIATMPPWPGAHESEDVTGPWTR